MVSFALLSACGGGAPSQDAATNDTVIANTDAAGGNDATTTPPTDATTTPPTDAMTTPPTDAGAMPVDAANPPADASVTPGASPTIAGCRIYPPDNPWNADVSRAPLHARSAEFIAAMNPTRAMHADWGDWSTNHYGIPWAAGMAAAPVALQWTTSWGPRESDPMPCPGGGGMFCYPIPTGSRIEGGPMAATGADRHVLFLDTAGAPNNCTLYELYNAQNFTAAPWRAANGAIFRLGSNALRPDQWTSADAAGLPILPGLVRVDEVLAGEIRHAIRFTMARTARGFIHPATHAAGTNGTNLPPMGLRLRLRASFTATGASPAAQAVLRAMQRYGIILADNGSDWYITGDSDDRWEPLIGGINRALGGVRGMDFEVIETGPIVPQG
jgi:hypothetical protein